MRNLPLTWPQLSSTLSVGFGIPLPLEGDLGLVRESIVMQRTGSMNHWHTAPVRGQTFLSLPTCLGLCSQEDVDVQSAS